MSRQNFSLTLILALPLLPLLGCASNVVTATEVEVAAHDSSVESRPAPGYLANYELTSDNQPLDPAGPIVGPAPSTASQAEPDNPGPTAPIATRLNPDMVRVSAGSFVPLFQQEGEVETRVNAFEIDRYQVTRGEYLEFVRANPRWRRSVIKPIFADQNYLAGWTDDLDIGDDDDARRPVTQVSWFAAKAFCEAQGARLPVAAEWEFAAAASATEYDGSNDVVFNQWLLELYTSPAPRLLPVVGTGFRNAYGIHEMHGPVREWVLDYNTVMVSDDSRGVGARDQQLYCAAGAVGSTRTDDYAAFLRYTFRSGLSGRSTADNLGFRCAGGR